MTQLLDKKFSRGIFIYCVYFGLNLSLIQNFEDQIQFYFCFSFIQNCIKQLATGNDNEPT